MQKVSQTGKLVYQLLIAFTVWIGVNHHGYAQDLSDPAQVVSQYLASLSDGDTKQLVDLMDGVMLQKNRQLVVKPSIYSEFLKKHYAGVQTTVENLQMAGDQMHARVRFDYPTQDSSKIILILSHKDSQWKITDEIY